MILGIIKLTYDLNAKRYKIKVYYVKWIINDGYIYFKEIVRHAEQLI